MGMNELFSTKVKVLIEQGNRNKVLKHLFR